MRLLLLFLVVFLVACQQEAEPYQQQSSEPKVCNKDAKVCPDGQTVSRNPKLNCQFDPCPDSAPEVECMDDMKQCSDGSFVIRDPEQQCAFKACPEQSKQKQPVVYCTQDVLQCDDGSYVGRDSNNNCEFKTCPDGSQPGHSKPGLD